MGKRFVCETPLCGWEGTYAEALPVHATYKIGWIKDGCTLFACPKCICIETSLKAVNSKQSKRTELKAE